MTSIPPSGQDRQRFGRPGSIRGEAARRGVSEYQVRRERAASGVGARVSRIPWKNIDDKQAQAIREVFPRNRWREIVEAEISNYQHYFETGQKLAEHNYRQEILNAARADEENVDDWIEDHGEEVVNSIFWYHANQAIRRL